MAKSFDQRQPEWTSLAKNGQCVLQMYETPVHRGRFVTYCRFDDLTAFHLSHSVFRSLQDKSIPWATFEMPSANTFIFNISP